MLIFFWLGGGIDIDGAAPGCAHGDDAAIAAATDAEDRMSCAHEETSALAAADEASIDLLAAQAEVDVAAIELDAALATATETNEDDC